MILAASVLGYRAKKTDRQTNGGKNQTPATAVGVRNNECQRVEFHISIAELKASSLVSTATRL